MVKKHGRNPRRGHFASEICDHHCELQLHFLSQSETLSKGGRVMGFPTKHPENKGESDMRL